MSELSVRLKGMFRESDSNQSNTISREKLESILKALDPSFTQAELDTLFSVADKNKDGVIQYEEFLDFICYFEQQAIGEEKKKEVSGSHKDHGFHEFHNAPAEAAPQHFPGIPDHKPEPTQKHSPEGISGEHQAHVAVHHQDHGFHEFHNAPAETAPQHFPGIPDHKPELTQKHSPEESSGEHATAVAGHHQDHAFHEFHHASGHHRNARNDDPGIPDHKPGSEHKKKHSSAWDKYGS